MGHEQREEACLAPVTDGLMVAAQASSAALGASPFLVMAGFVLVGPPLAARLLRRLTRHVASDGPTSNTNRDAPRGIETGYPVAEVADPGPASPGPATTKPK